MKTNTIKPKVFFKTYGCSFNQLDTEIMKTNLEKDSFTITNNDKNADLVIINSCSVKNLSEAKFFNDIKKYKQQNKKIIACGCVPQAEPSYLTTKLLGISVLGTNDLNKISQITTKTLQNKPTQILSSLYFDKTDKNTRKEKENMRLNLTSNHNSKQNKLIQIIAINEGCLNSCTYCKTKQARGNLFSYSIESIKKCMQNAINNGAKEIYLTSQDTACYGFDIQTNLPNLLRELLTIKGDYRIRIGMGNPHHFKIIIDEILQIMKEDDRIYKFLHIPVQSGNNRILKEMRRMYTVEDYQEIVAKAKKAIPKITISNDIIVAYPTETQEEFQDTIKCLKTSQTNVLNFSRFWLRTGTPAEKLYSKKDFIEGLESKTRAKIIKQEFQKIALVNNKKWIGWTGKVLITEKGKKGTNSYIGRNEYYKPIVIRMTGDEKLEIGEKVEVKISEVTWFDFRAEIVRSM